VDYLTVDKHKMLQILVNLLRNAKYACDESGSSGKQVTVRIKRAGTERVRVEIADNGVGIPPENLTRIFRMDLRRASGDMGLDCTVRRGGAGDGRFADGA